MSEANRLSRFLVGVIFFGRAGAAVVSGAHAFVDARDVAALVGSVVDEDVSGASLDRASDAEASGFSACEAAAFFVPVAVGLRVSDHAGFVAQQVARDRVAFVEVALVCLGPAVFHALVFKQSGGAVLYDPAVAQAFHYSGS